MRVFLTAIAVVLLSSCMKKQVVVNRLEGEWRYVKFLQADGSYLYFSDITYDFDDGKADGKTFLELEIDSAGIESVGKYLVNKKASQIYFVYNNGLPEKSDTVTIEDMDKKSLVVRDKSGVRFFEKIDD